MAVEQSVSWSDGTFPRVEVISRKRYVGGLWRYSDGGEACAVEVVDVLDPDTGEWLPARGKYVPKGMSEEPEKNARRNARRAAIELRRTARANAMKFLWTLTYPQPCKSRVEAERTLRGFLKRHGQQSFKGSYLAVVEKHQSGGYHWHVLTNFRVDVTRVKVLWTRYLAREGFPAPTDTPSKLVRVHVKEFRGGAASRDAAGYVAKYVSKDLEAEDREMGGHRYLRGEMVGEPIHEPGEWDSLPHAMIDLADDAGLDYRRVKVWRTDDMPKWEGPPAWGFDW